MQVMDSGRAHLLGTWVFFVSHVTIADEPIRIWTRGEFDFNSNVSSTSDIFQIYYL